jgi:hypothetical protein
LALAVAVVAEDDEALNGPCTATKTEVSKLFVEQVVTA